MKLGFLLFVLSISTAAASPADDTLAESRRAFLAARSALGDGRYQDALALYRKVLEIVPNDPIVHLEYAQLLRDLNVPDEATRQARDRPARSEPRRGAAPARDAGARGADKDSSRLPAAIDELSAAHRLAPNDLGTP